MITFEDLIDTQSEKPKDENKFRDLYEHNIRNIRETFKNFLIFILSEALGFVLSRILIIGTQSGQD